jgi:hypothetical protein
LTTGVVGVNDIWEATILPERVTAIEDMNNFIKNCPEMDLFISKNTPITSFKVVGNNPGLDLSALTIFNARGVSVYSRDINQKTAYEFSPALVPGFYTIQATALNQQSIPYMVQKSFTIVH